MKLGILEHVHVGQNCSVIEIEEHQALFKDFQYVFTQSYEKMMGIDPYSVVHEIKAYPTTRLVSKKLHQV